MSGVLQTLEQNIQIVSILKDEPPSDEDEGEAPLSDEQPPDEGS